MKTFSELQLNECFSLNFGPGKYLHYKKISKSEALIINQIGYGNKRMVGDIQPFAPFSKTWSVK